MLKLFQLELPFLRFSARPGEEARRIQLGVRIVDYRLVRAARRRLGMTVDQRGLRVGASLRTPLREVERFLQHNADWVVRKLDEWHGEGARRPLVVREGAMLPVLGEEHAVRIEPGGNRFVWQERALVLRARPDADLGALATRALRARALEVFSARVDDYAATMRLARPALALSSAHTRWGSCSEASGIRLSWRLIHSPLRVIDYVVVHELAHLVEMNHSRRFWALVERHYPGYRAVREELKQLAITCPQIR